METERSVLMVSEKKQKENNSLKKNPVEGEKYNDKNVLIRKLNFFSSMYTLDVDLIWRFQEGSVVFTYK